MARSTGLAPICAILLATPLARAESEVEIDVSGACPTRAQQHAALGAEGIGAAPGVPWLVRIASDSSPARLEIVEASSGRVAATRTVRSDDCGAIADMFALIVRAHLEAIAAAPPPVAPPPAIAQPSLAAIRHEPAAALTAPGLSARREPRSPRLSLGVATGLGVADTASTSVAAGQLDIGVARADGWGLRLVAAVGADAFGQTVERHQLAAKLDIGQRRSRTRLWWRPAVGAGVALSSVTVPAVPLEPRVTRLHPTIGGSLAGGVAVSDVLSLRAELTVDVFPIADNYTATDLGEVGRSPQVIVGLGFGVQFDGL